MTNDLHARSKDGDSGSPGPDVFHVDWTFFGELCRVLALKVATGFDPQIVVGVAKAGVIPGVVVAAMLDRDFASMAVTRAASRARPTLVTEPPASVRGLRVLVVDETCNSGDTLKLAVSAIMKHSPAEIKSAVSIKTGPFVPDFFAMESEGEIVLPWEEDVVLGGRIVTRSAIGESGRP